jgi:glycosyltransferase involved in cell wall biosynthesis
VNINIFYRKKAVDRHSIEKVYDTVIDFLHDFEVTKIEMPYKSKGIFKRISNIIFTTKNQAQLNHITGDINYISFFMKRGSVILSIHDIYPLYRTKGLKRFILKNIWFKVPIKKASKIVVISEFSKNEVLKHFNVDLSKLQVIYNCVSPLFKYSLKPFNTDQPTILHLGTKNNKNLNRLIEASKDINIKLIIIGHLSDDQLKKLKQFNTIYENFQYVSDLKLIELYQTCDIVSFISTYEGFGLPIIEAQAMGRVVLTSNIASMPEVAGKGAMLVDPFSISEIKNGIIELINNIELREALINHGLVNVKRFEAQKVAKQYINLYKEVISDQ